MPKELFNRDDCGVVIEKAVSKKTGKEYQRLVLLIGDKSYFILDNNTINRILLDFLLS